MIVDSVFNIKGRGTVITVRDAPTNGLIPGVLLHQGESCWVLRGIERYATALPLPHHPIALYLDSYDVAQYGVPEVGKELNL